LASAMAASPSNALGFEYADGYKFDYPPESEVVEAPAAAEPLPFHKYNLHPSEHGLHPAQRTEVPLKNFGDEREERFQFWSTKEYSHGAIHTQNPYKRGDGFAAEGFSGYKPLWRPPDNPLDGGKGNKLYSNGTATYPGYMGNRPGEAADPFVSSKLNTTEKRALAPWEVQPRDSSMATRIAQRRLEAVNSRMKPPPGSRAALEEGP